MKKEETNLEANEKSLDPKLLSVNKRLDSKDVCGVNDHRRVKHFHLRELRVEERKNKLEEKEIFSSIHVFFAESTLPGTHRRDVIFHAL